VFSHFYHGLLDQSVPLGAADAFLELMGGNTWIGSGFTGDIGLTSTPLDSNWFPYLGCAPPTAYTCYLTPEIRINDGVPAQTLVVEGLRDYIADPEYGSWLVDTSVQAETPEPNFFWLVGGGLVCFFIVRLFPLGCAPLRALRT